jgi:sensor histidine kinase YesM
MNNLLDIEDSIRRVNRFFFIGVVPGLCIIIPNLAGIFHDRSFSSGQLVLSYVYFGAMSILIWQGNIHLSRLRKAYEKATLTYLERLFYYFFACMAYSGLITFAGLAAWLRITNPYTSIDWGSLFIAASVVMISVLLVNSIRELLSERKEVEESAIRFKRMEIAKVQAELEAVKAEVDPHFIFNSLNTLSYLITIKPEAARQYNETLASVYRYILLNKDIDLVLLKDELEFVENYFYLVRMRFEDAVNMIIEISAAEADNYLITPVSLQMLIENAIKHNYFSRKSPLEIRVNIQSLFVTVKNRVKRKDYEGRSSGIGLRNLKERYRLIMKRNIIIHRENEEFLVKLPIIKA